MSAYSFLNVSGLIAGPGGAANLANGAMAAEEGVTIEAAADKNEMTIGADGNGQHSLIANNAATVTVRLLKRSPMNALLMLMYDIQSASSALWGTNVITITDSGGKDLHVIQKCAFKKKPAINYAQTAGMIEWVFEGISANSVLGVG